MQFFATTGTEQSLALGAQTVGSICAFISTISSVR